MRDGGDHLIGRFPGPADRRPALLLGHYDTVWPLGTIDRLPFRVDNGRAYGPGIYDMKAGLTIILTVLEKFVKRWACPRPIWVLFTSDEEIGSPSSRGLIEQLARECAYALVLEPPLADGSLKTAPRASAISRSTSKAGPPMPGSPPKTDEARSSSWPIKSFEFRTCRHRPPARLSTWA